MCELQGVGVVGGRDFIGVSEVEDSVSDSNSVH